MQPKQDEFEPLPEVIYPDQVSEFDQQSAFGAQNELLNGREISLTPGEADKPEAGDKPAGQNRRRRRRGRGKNPDGTPVEAKPQGDKAPEKPAEPRRDKRPNEQSRARRARIRSASRRAKSRREKSSLPNAQMAARTRPKRLRRRRYRGNGNKNGNPQPPKQVNEHIERTFPQGKVLLYRSYKSAASKRRTLR